MTRFLDASKHLYKRVCPSVRPYVRPSVTNSDFALRTHLIARPGLFMHLLLNILTPEYFCFFPDFTDNPPSVLNEFALWQSRNHGTDNVGSSERSKILVNAMNSIERVADDK